MTEPGLEGEEPTTLATQLAELSNRPVDNRPLDRLRARAIDTAERATSWGPLGPWAEIAWQTARRDVSIGGSVLAAALAYRLFIWLLPLVLVLVLTLASIADLVGETTSAVLSDAGLTGYIASSVSAAAGGTGGWAWALGLAGGIVVLLYETYALLRALRAVTALAWHLPVRPPPNPPRATLLFLCWIVALALVTSSASAIRARLALPVDLLAGAAVYSLLPAFFVGLSWWLLPHAAQRWTELVPGAVLVGGALAAIGLFNSLVLFPWLTRKEETYGVLGVAAGLLFSFFLMGRMVELAAALNAVLTERRHARRLAG